MNGVGGYDNLPPSRTSVRRGPTDAFGNYGGPTGSRFKRKLQQQADDGYDAGQEKRPCDGGKEPIRKRQVNKDMANNAVNASDAIVEQ